MLRKEKNSNTAGGEKKKASCLFPSLTLGNLEEGGKNPPKRWLKRKEWQSNKNTLFRYLIIFSFFATLGLLSITFSWKFYQRENFFKYIAYLFLVFTDFSSFISIYLIFLCIMEVSHSIRNREFPFLTIIFMLSKIHLIACQNFSKKMSFQFSLFLGGKFISF